MITTENSAAEHNYKITNCSELSKQVIENLLNNLNAIKVFYLLEQLIYSLNKKIDLSISRGEKQPSENSDFAQNINDFYFILDILGFKFDLPSYDLKIKLLIKE